MFDYQNGKTEESKTVEAALRQTNVPLHANNSQPILLQRRQRLLAMQNIYGNRIAQRFAHATPRQAIQRMEQEHAAPKTQIDTFVVKAIESRSDSDKYTRSTSKSNRYDFRYPHAANLPESGGDPTKKSASEKQPSNGYFYHVTSYFNLAKIFDSGLNPAAGGGVGGSSFQSEDTEMGDASAKDSQNKVFVATVSKLTERYLSLRLRQEDLFNKHQRLIFSVLKNKFGINKNSRVILLEHLQMGEMPAVLRFKNQWAKTKWEPDKIEKKAFALVGTPVPPQNIECMTIHGWQPLMSLIDLKAVYKRQDIEEKFRVGMLNFFRKYNEMLGASDEYAAEAKLANDLFTELQEAGFKF